MLRHLAIWAGLAAAVLAGIPAASADEMASIYARILANPTDAALNLQYAKLAEQAGEYRMALSAYERVLVNDPNNVEGKQGLQRVRRIIQPAETQKTLEIGATWQSNPLAVADGASDDFNGYASLRVRDERAVGGHRWRTNLQLYGEAYADNTDLDYASARADIGPIIDLTGTQWDARPAVGAGTAYFDGKTYYWDANATALFEGYLNGAYQWVRLRAGYREYDPSFTSNAGSYADISAKFSAVDVFHEGDVLSVSPWYRWSGIDGTPDNGDDDFATGLYREGGATFEYWKKFSDVFGAAVNLKVSDRVYDDIGGGSRHDWLVSPGASIVFSNVFGPQTDLRFDYKYEWNRSNMDAHTWENQAATVAVVIRR
jgi:tetratricopeptide (TPR) repeat protein